MAAKDRMPASEFQSKCDLSEHSSTAEVNEDEDDYSSDDDSSMSSDSTTTFNSEGFTISNESNESNDTEDDYSIISHEEDDYSVVKLLKEEEELVPTNEDHFMEPCQLCLLGGHRVR